MVDKVKDVVDDMTDASGDRDDKVRRNEKVAGVIPGVFTQVWNYGRNSRCVHSGLEVRACVHSGLDARGRIQDHRDLEDKGGVQPRVQE